MSRDLLAHYRRKLHKALDHLAYSSGKVAHLTVDPVAMDEEVLETWESFTARFSRVVDLFLSKYLRAVIAIDDPGFSGTMRDYANQAEKLGLIESADQWMEFRGFRNLISLEYEEDELRENFEDLRRLTPYVLKIKDQLNAPQAKGT